MELGYKVKRKGWFSWGWIHEDGRALEMSEVQGHEEVFANSQKGYAATLKGYAGFIPNRLYSTEKTNYHKFICKLGMYA